jgi:multiple antibiotic resistance protein
VHWEHDIQVFLALFAVMAPLGAIPLFLALTPDDPSVRRKTALKAGLITFAILLTAFFVGDLILAAFEIEMDAFRMAGGLIIASIGWKMVFGSAKTAAGADNRNPALIPLSIPWLAGPGAMAVVIALGESDPTEFILEDIAIILIVSVLSVIILLFANPIGRFLREEGIDVITRIFGLLLLAIAIGSILVSLANFFPGLTQ